MRLGLPLTEFDSNAATVSHSISTGSATLTNAVSSVKNSTHFQLVLGEIGSF